MQILRKNFALKILSVVLALGGWSYFRFANNPLITARFDQQLSVPITVIHLPVGYVAKYLDKEALVSIAAPKRGAPPLKPDDVKAVLDLGNRTVGVYNVPVELVAPNAVVQSLSPASVTLTVEKVEQRTFPLAVHYNETGNRAIVTSESNFSPTTVQVRGSSGDLSHVAAVLLNVLLPATPSKFDAMVHPIAVDASGAEVSNVQVSPNLIRMRARFVAGVVR
ncbi:MAG: hypothetical protein DLM50_01680 [Candidatus Meridianibacter frigidus]|nr:MAG: hypothetical protein DLM50_01680 [Candidatus Eremiobacteraeota bacterium]